MTSNSEVRDNLFLFKSGEAHDKSYTKVRPPETCHLWHNHCRFEKINTKAVSWLYVTAQKGHVLLHNKNVNKTNSILYHQIDCLVFDMISQSKMETSRKHIFWHCIDLERSYYFQLGLVSTQMECF